MAAPQAFQAYTQNKGTLVSGQSITVNKLNVQVERYLSQGGFAHVYLVRTATPVYNTTHHVLKRIAVSNEAMLSEVKKEVDIMRLLKGHPNIVHLIDAAWHRLPNGLYEVFILMEFCPGGGIIEMMNRRLRERLTESEILQIFVDVCEGVACMHNLRPPLLHRDLKVENILQSTPTSFKLCDFGSSATVTKPPTTTQEIRALEADLNRHTTLQYRAPEMIDLFQRRPVDEKSDVWALGVLLYKLCYYTTPFEEHGPLAILNVQYRIPPYPVYSLQMNALIASMLREHGAQRPTVFELLAEVHRLRGTKSQFQYAIPAHQPLSARPPNSSSKHSALENTITYHKHPSTSTPPPSSSPAKNAGVQAREKVLEAIEPMRRGRPTPSTSQPSSPQKEVKNWLDGGFDAEEDKAWKSATAVPTKTRNALDDAWTIGSKMKDTSSAGAGKAGFGDDFGEKLWEEFDAKAPKTQTQTKQSSSSMLAPSSGARPNLPGKKDAFEGLGLMTSSDKPAPTLAEARKLRTGLAIVNSPGKFPSRPTLSPRISYISPSQVPTQQNLSPAPPPIRPSASGSSWSSQPPSSRPSSTGNTEIESRFPSLEELDAQFGSSVSQAASSGSGPKNGGHVPRQPKVSSSRPSPQDFSGKSGNLGSAVDSNGNLRPSTRPSRSEHTTGAAMKESRGGKAPESIQLGTKAAPRPSLTRKHRSSVSIKQASPLFGGDDTPTAASFAPAATSSKGQPTGSGAAPKLPPRPSLSASARDWLTGDDSDTQSNLASTRSRSTQSEKPVLRESPSKRASYIEKSSVPIQEAVSAFHGHVTLSSSALPSPNTERSSPSSSPTIAKFTRNFPPIDTTPSDSLKTDETLPENWSPGVSRRIMEPESSSSGDEGPEEANRYVHAAPETPQSKRPRRKGRQSSVHDLVDLWGGGLTSPSKDKEKTDIENTTPTAHKSSGLDKAARRRSTALPASTKAKHNNTGVSLKLPTTDTGRVPLSLALSAGRQAVSPASPASGRSRPQSMFAFPTKPSDAPPPPFPGLVPPHEPKPRENVRRTSISDMVQRFEAIDAVSRLPPRSASPAPVKPSTLNTPVENGRVSRTHTSSPSISKLNGRIGLSLPDELANRDMSRRVSPAMSRTSPVRLPITSSLSSEDVREDTEAIASRARRTSTKPEPPNSKPTFPSLKSPVTTDDSSRSSDTRSSSPERPYQGVGKLIDQWQRKAETEKPIPKRGGFVTKRAGLVSGGSERT